MNDEEAIVERIIKDLDRLEMELAMNREAMESIEMTARFLKEELDYHSEGR